MKVFSPGQLDLLAERVAHLYAAIGRHAGQEQFIAAVRSALPQHFDIELLRSRLEAKSVPVFDVRAKR